MIKRIMSIASLFISAQAFALPDFMNGEPGIWHDSGNGISWVVASTTGTEKAAMQFICHEELGARVASVLIHFDEQYSDNAEVRAVGPGLEALSLTRIEKTKMYELGPLNVAVNMLYKSPDNGVLPLMVLDGKTRHVYVFGMQDAAVTVKSVLEHCGAI